MLGKVQIACSTDPPAACGVFGQIGGGHGWKIELPDITEGDARTRPPGLGSQVDLGLTDITKYPSYSKLWRML